jgi:hypothetical protein
MARAIFCVTLLAACHSSVTEVAPPDDDQEHAELVVIERGVADAAAPCREETPGSSRREQVCARWCRVREESRVAAWSGDAASCTSGAIDPKARESARRILDTHRFLADLPPVDLVTDWEPSAARCALLAHANRKLSHEPPADWRCWDDTGRRASEVSLIANRSIAIAITAFFEDPGNETTMTHRRWLLGDSLSHVAFGSTDRYACLVVDGSGLGAKSVGDPAAKQTSMEPKSELVAWPPAGEVPIDLFRFERLDELGWTVQSSTLDLESAVVSVTTSGQELPMAVVALERWKGSRSALKLTPIGWKTEASKRYTVHVTGDAIDASWVVEPTDCE